MHPDSAVKNRKNFCFGGKDVWFHIFLCHQILERTDLGGKVQQQGRNRELLASCEPLSEYSLFTSNVRQYFQQYRDMDQAVGLAMEKLPEESEIRALLEANRAEVRDMCLTEYDAERENKILKKQYYAAGMEKGLEKGMEKGMEKGADRMGALGSILLKDGRTEDLQKAFTDPAYREKLFKELGIA